MDKCTKINTVIPDEMSGMRLDQALANILPEYSRSILQNWIRDDRIKINNRSMRPRDHVHGGEQVEIWAETVPQTLDSPENIPLDIIFEDEHIIIINKPAGLVVHPGAGNPQHTLVNALLHHDQKFTQIPRAGIVHRLDKQTTGLMIIARTLQSHTYLVNQLRARNIQRQYIALVNGILITGGSIEQPIGRHPRHRTKMTVVHNGRPAKTHYRINRKYKHHTQLQISLETGRTHQVRVHMEWLGHAIISDPVYRSQRVLSKGMSPGLANIIKAFPRQALHACVLKFSHPQSHEILEWQQPVPADMSELINALETDAES